MPKRIFIILVLGFTACSMSVSAQELTDASAADILTMVKENAGTQPVIVNFWATWCAPCIEEFPYLMKLNDKYGGQFKLIFVSGDFDEARNEAITFLDNQGVTFETYFKKGKDHEFITTISDKWTGALPFTIVYNKEGKVTASWEGKAEYEKFESELLNVINEE